MTKKETKETKEETRDISNTKEEMIKKTIINA